MQASGTGGHRSEPADGTGSDPTGWVRRTTIDEPRLSELVELYEELGFEVRLCPISPEELGGECQECLLLDPQRYRTIYTRRRADPAASNSLR